MCHAVSGKSICVVWGCLRCMKSICQALGYVPYLLRFISRGRSTHTKKNMPHLFGDSLPEIFHCVNNYLQDHDHHTYSNSQVWGCWALPAKASPPDDHLPTRTAPIDCNLWWFMVVTRPGIFTKTTAPDIKSSNGSWFAPSKWNLLWVKSLKFNSRSVVCFVVGS